MSSGLAQADCGQQRAGGRCLPHICRGAAAQPCTSPSPTGVPVGFKPSLLLEISWVEVLDSGGGQPQGSGAAPGPKAMPPVSQSSHSQLETEHRVCYSFPLVLLTQLCGT